MVDSTLTMATAADFLLTYGCVWTAFQGATPTADVQHVDLWWQPAASLAHAREACVASRLCTGISWNEADKKFKMLSGAVTHQAAHSTLRPTHSVHRHACSVEAFRRALKASGGTVVFVVTTVQKRRANAKLHGVPYFTLHLDSMLPQNVPVIYVQGAPDADEEAMRIVSAAHGGAPVMYVRPPKWPEHLWRPPKKPHKAAKWFAKEGWEWAWAMLFGYYATEGINCVDGKEVHGISTVDGKEEKGGAQGGCGPSIVFLEDDMIASENVLSVLEHLPVKPPPDVLGMSLWDADKSHLWHRCFNCYSKAIMYAHGDVKTLGTHVIENFYQAPVDWLVDDFGRDVLRRYNRCLVPNLAEHIGDISSNGERRAWQKSPNFAKRANRADYVAGPIPDFPVVPKPQRLP